MPAIACWIGSLAMAQSFVTGGVSPGYAVRAGDVDGDGRSDVCVLGATFTVVGSATGAVLPYLTRPGGSSATAYVPVGDVDADGHDDLAYVGAGSAAVVEVVSGADGTTRWSLTCDTPSVVGCQDIDGDGCADLAIHYVQAGGDVAELRSGRTGAILLRYTGTAGITSESFGPAGDVDGDGCPDLAATTFRFANFYSTTTILRGPTLVYGGSYGAEFAPLGDLDGNGRADVWHYHLPSGASGYQIVEGGGTVLLSLPGTPLHGRQALPLGDVDGDGHADVLLLDATLQSLGVLSGRTLLPLPGAVPASTRSLGDTDGDGRDELGYGSTTTTRLEWVDPAFPTTSRMVVRGASGTTTSGRRPRLDTRGSCALGRTVFFDLRGAEPNGFAFLVVGAAADVDLAPFGAPHNRSLTTLLSSLLLPTDAHGLAVQAVTLPATPALLGATVSVQFAAVDPSANALGLATSNAIDLTTAN